MRRFVGAVLLATVVLVIGAAAEASAEGRVWAGRGWASVTDGKQWG